MRHPVIRAALAQLGADQLGHLALHQLAAHRRFGARRRVVPADRGRQQFDTVIIVQWAWPPCSGRWRRLI
jgi:hypothetical protein